MYAYIDKQVLNLVMQEHGWRLDLEKLRSYLSDTYAVEKAFIFIRYSAKDKEVHKALQNAGYICLFISPQENEATYALNAILYDQSFDKAVIFSGNDEYHVLLEKLRILGKLSTVFFPQAVPPPSFDRYSDVLVNIGLLRAMLEKGKA